MLYVKSSPSGAAVVIEGKVRGKTPVLVRDLPAGDVTVELRIAGAKPVTRQATVSANKVLTIDVTVEVPSATLTVISDPLEATVFIDDRDVGKTPVTLEHLDPGGHKLILLKDGYPRTARSVVLESGAERVLEVKLGVPGEDETARPASSGAAAQAEAPAPVPVEVQLILTMLKEAVANGGYPETRRNMELALGQPDMASFKEELRAGIEVVRALEARQDAIRDGADALVGKETTFRTKTGPRKGRVKGVSVEGITVATKIMIDRRPVGETRAVIKWSALAPEEQDRLAGSWKPEGPDGAVARALVALARKDESATARALDDAGEHPLGKHLARKGEAPADEATERAARSAWRRIEGVKVPSAAKARELSRKLADFERNHGKTPFAGTVRRQLASLKDYAELVPKLPPGAAYFGGHWYCFYGRRMSWHEAKRFCEQQGGHLVTITSKAENGFVSALARAARSNSWIGFSDERVEGRWEWVTGEQVQFTCWYPGEPNDMGGEDYAHLSIKKVGWHDYDRPGKFICEWEP
jgi:hypothetical protein